MHVHANASSSAQGWDKSPAQQARSKYNSEPSPGFGQIVSQLARGVYDPSSTANSLTSGASSDGTDTAAADSTAGSSGTTPQDSNTDPGPTQTSTSVDLIV
jgi:hypothetical protein